MSVYRSAEHAIMRAMNVDSISLHNGAGWKNKYQSEGWEAQKADNPCPLDKFDQLTQDKPHMRAGQKRLAEEMTTMVHGVAATESVLAASLALFGRGELGGQKRVGGADPVVVRGARRRG